MKVETRMETVPIYDIVYDGIEIISQPYIGDKEIIITDIYADEGKVLIEKATGKVLSDHITIGTEDSMENYEEIKKEMIQ